MMSSPFKKIKNMMKLNYQRQQKLVIKHGTYVLRCILDRFIPANQLQSTLQTSQVKAKIINDGNRNILSQKQIDQLYPSNGQPNPEYFDITLLTYILRNHCGPHLDPKSPWWSIKDNGIIPRANTDIVADIVRLRNLRNKLNHTANASLDKNEFETDWSLAEEVLLRLAARFGIIDMKKKIEKVIIESQTPEFKRLREDTTRFLQDNQDEDWFVETKAFNEALQSLEKNNVVVLKGLQGEGKTTMAARLALKTAESKYCLKLKQSSDWHHVDMSGNMFKVIIIDDVLGVYYWKDVLSEISSAVQKKQIKVIITSRYDILKYFGNIPMFQNTDGNDPVVQLKSIDLLEEEQMAIVQAQAKRYGRQVPHQLMMECVQNYRDNIYTLLLLYRAFTNWVSAFLTYDDIFNKGSVFFKSPRMHLESHIRDFIFSPIECELFTPLALVASKEEKMFSYEEVKKAKTTIDHVERVASLFGRKVDNDFLETLKQSLDSLIVRGFLKYDERTEQYSFTHSIVGDIVRQVLAEKIAEQANQIGPRDARMENVGQWENQTLNFKKRKMEMCC